MAKFKNSVKAVKGPSKLDLMWGLIQRKEVEFTVEPVPFQSHVKNVFRIKVKGMVAADDSFEPESWIIIGGIVGIGQWSREPSSISVEEIALRNCRIHFNTQRRVGNIRY